MGSTWKRELGAGARLQGVADIIWQNDFQNAELIAEPCRSSPLSCVYLTEAQPQNQSNGCNSFCLVSLSSILADVRSKYADPAIQKTSGAMQAQDPLVSNAQ